MTQQSSKIVPTEGSASQLVQYLLDRVLGGVGPLSSAENLAQESLIDQGYVENDERVDAPINWETAKSFTTGFLTGLGGVITLTAAVPSALRASWLIQARLVGTIALSTGTRSRRLEHEHWYYWRWPAMLPRTR
jgi:hypothetical protein